MDENGFWDVNSLTLGEYISDSNLWMARCVPSGQGCYISPETEEDASSSQLELEFAREWVQRYPELDLISQVPFWRHKKLGGVRQSVYRADFAWGGRWLWRFQDRKPYLYQLLPPGVLIELEGGVHSIKYHSDSEREALALEMGFTIFRLTKPTMLLKLDAIAETIRMI